MIKINIEYGWKRTWNMRHFLDYFFNAVWFVGANPLDYQVDHEYDLSFYNYNVLYTIQLAIA